MAKIQQLDFASVDDLAFASERGRFNSGEFGVIFSGNRLGPFLELWHLQEAALVPADAEGRWFAPGHLAGFSHALAAGKPRWTCPDKSKGFLRLGSAPDEHQWIAFAIDAKRAAVASGLTGRWAAQMTAAIGELRSNVYEHCGTTNTGLVAFCSAPGTFEFVAVDAGQGVLATLREATMYRGLSDHGEALRLALTDGASRYELEEGRGLGFRDLFVGLANRNASLRFRSGTSSLTIDGTGPNLSRAQVGKKAPIAGFLASVTCLT
jgi:anti-sigma regulatory factor (Ser/Thr protein kinase)